jgi:hypothetical protein
MLPALVAVAHIILHAIFVLGMIALIMCCFFFAMVCLYLAFGPKADPDHRSSRRE